ncbi:hypothetical protein GCM10019016_031160 [Streptomyces prasinosporus]|uniref:Uncharacterized protein n=1 Tax=Streptomyces prasinosporus TaxID=68256 RepID=A0ABP6TL92_9ACTN
MHRGRTVRDAAGTAGVADGRHPEPAEARAPPGRPLTPEAASARFPDRLVDGPGTRRLTRVPPRGGRP